MKGEAERERERGRERKEQDLEGVGGTGFLEKKELGFSKNATAFLYIT